MLRPYLVERPHVVQDDVGVCRHRLPEDPTLPVPGTPGLRARGRLQVVNEPLHDATFDERSEEHTSELQSQSNLVCRLLLEKKKNYSITLAMVKTRTTTNLTC